MDNSLYKSTSQEQQNFYTRYINSREWKLKRREVLKRDNHQCQTCLAIDNLEVHHKTYKRLGNENLIDLITLCSSCHDAITSSIRFRRQAKRGVMLLSTLADKSTDTVSEDKKEVILNGIKGVELKEKIRIKKNEVKLIATKFNRR